MDKEIELFTKYLEKNFSNQVIDEFILVKVEKEYPSTLEPQDINISDSFSFLDSCFSIWDISSRLIVQNKKPVTANSKYVLRLRLLSCRLMYLLFKKEDELMDDESQEGEETIPTNNKKVSMELRLPLPFQDDEIALEVLKMFIRCAQNCFEAEDQPRLSECLWFLKYIEERYSLSSQLFLQNPPKNTQIYLLTHRWLLQLYNREPKDITKKLITVKFPKLLEIMSQHHPSEEKEQIFILMLMILCKLLTRDIAPNKREIAVQTLMYFQDYRPFIESLRPSVGELFKKMLIYTSIQNDSIQKEEIPHLYEALMTCSGDKLTEYLKLLVELRLKCNNGATDDVDFLVRKVEFMMSQHDIEPEEYYAFIEELCTIHEDLHSKYYVLLLSKFLDVHCCQGNKNARIRGRKVDLIAIKLAEYWVDKLTQKEAIIATERANLQEDLEVILKCIVKERVTTKKLPVLEREMVSVARLLVMKKEYEMCFQFLENLLVLVKKDQVQMLKEICVLQIENCFYLKKREAAPNVFELLTSIEKSKDDFLYNVCRLKVYLTVVMDNDEIENEGLIQEAPLYFDSVLESRNFDENTFFFLTIEFLQHGLSGQNGGRIKNQTIILKEFFLVLRKGLERVINHHLNQVNTEVTEEVAENKENEFPLFRLFCIYLSSFTSIFEKGKKENQTMEEKAADLTDVFLKNSIGSILEVGFLILETFRIVCEKYAERYSPNNEVIGDKNWLAREDELLFIDSFYWNIAILVGYLNLDLNFALRFIFLSLKIKLMRIVLDNIKKFGAFMQFQENMSDVNIDTELFLQFCIYDAKELNIDNDLRISLIKTLLLYVSNTLCLLKTKEFHEHESLSNSNLILKCLELDRLLIFTSNLEEAKVQSYLQYHCLLEFEYRILESPESVCLFIEEFCTHAQVEPELFLVFADIAKKLNKRDEYLLCLRGHVKASLKDKAVPSLSVECYVELLENSITIEEEISYLRQLMNFLDENEQALNEERSMEDVIQDLEYIHLFCSSKAQHEISEDKKELYMVKGLLLEEIQRRTSSFVPTFRGPKP